MQAKNSLNTLALDLHALPFRIKTQKNGPYCYVVGYQKARELDSQGRSRSVDVNRIQIGTLLDNGQVRLSKTFVRKYPQFQGFEEGAVYYLKNRLLTKALYQESYEECQQSEEDLAPLVDDEAQTLIAGPVSVYQDISNEMRLKERLQIAFGKKAGRDLHTFVLALAVMAKESLHGLTSFTKSHYVPGASHLTEKRLTELLRVASDQELQMEFWKTGVERLSNEGDAVLGLVCDGTSITTYGDILDAALGHNKQNEKQKQVNYMCLLNPINHDILFAQTYQGSIPDVAFYTPFLKLFEETHITKKMAVSLCCDRGFVSENNITYQLTHNLQINMAVSFSQHGHIASNGMSLMETMLKKAPRVDSNLCGYQMPDTNHTILNADTMERTTYSIPTYLFFNWEKFHRDMAESRHHVYRCIEQKEMFGHAEANLESRCRRFIKVSTTPEGNKVYELNGEALEKQMYKNNAFALLCNSRKTMKEALMEYRCRNEIELFFRTLKNTMGAERLHVGEAGYQGILFLKTLAASMYNKLNLRLEQASQENDELPRIYIPDFMDLLSVVVAKRYRGTWELERPIAKTRRYMEAIGIKVR